MRVACFLFMIIVTSNMLSQDLKTHQWKNRLLLVFSDDKNSDVFKEQINILSKDKEGLL